MSDLGWVSLAYRGVGADRYQGPLSPPPDYYGDDSEEYEDDELQDEDLEEEDEGKEEQEQDDAAADADGRVLDMTNAEIIGPELSEAHIKALRAIRTLLERGDAQDAEHGWKALLRSFVGGVPMSYHEYFEAHGLDGDGCTEEHDEALQALADLAQPQWRIAYVSKRWMGKGNYRRRVADCVVPRAPFPLISISLVYIGLEEWQLPGLEAGQDLAGRECCLLVHCHPMTLEYLRRATEKEGAKDAMA